MSDLTKREIEIFNLVTLGFDNSEISKKLRISTNTTKSCISNIYKKLEAKHKIVPEKQQSFIY